MRCLKKGRKVIVLFSNVYSTIDFRIVPAYIQSNSNGQVPTYTKPTSNLAAEQITGGCDDKLTNDTVFKNI